MLPEMTSCLLQSAISFQEEGWNGLIQELIAHKADMCVTSLKLNSERARDIDFSVPFLETGISIIVKIRSGVLSPTAFLGNNSTLHLAIY